MSRKKKKRGLKNLNVKKPLYLNANLIFSETLKSVKKFSWCKSGTLLKLQEEGYHLVTSILSRAEIIKKLDKEKGIDKTKAREAYKQTLESFKIVEVNGLHNIVPLTDSFIDTYSKTKLSFRDKIHLSIAKHFKIPFCTHDKKLTKGLMIHGEKKKFYDKVFKPGELIKTK
jgi:predicted nucleic acid-binding protein